ncbi:MAG: hypothetical protein AAGD35_17535 [Actinomycetota bacterium]
MVDAVAGHVGTERPPAPSGSGFRFVHELEAPRDVADVSALAQELDVVGRSVHEQPLTMAPLPTDIPAVVAAAPTRDAASAEAALGSATEAAVGTLTDAVARAETMLGAPSESAARERAEQACQAYRNHWFDDAERLFLDATELLPTAPFLWFGAGLAAARIAPARGAEHLHRAARYLAAVDPPGAAYAAVVAATLAESAGDVPLARRVLLDTLGALGLPCSSISLHLARLGPDRQQHLTEALRADPLVEADLAALGLDGGVALGERLRALREELGVLERSIGQYRQVDDGPAFADASSYDDAAPEEPLPLVRLEVELWRRLRQCEQERRHARRAVVERERARVEVEREIEASEELARTDLDHAVAIPVFAVGLLGAAVVLGGFLIGPLLTRSFPAWTVLINLVVLLAQLAAVAFFSRLFAATVWSRRSYLRARQAKIDLPRIRFRAQQLRAGEFEVSVRYNDARRTAEQHIDTVLRARRQIVPRRPHFGGGHLIPPDMGL